MGFPLGRQAVGKSSLRFSLEGPHFDTTTSQPGEEIGEGRESPCTLIG